MMIDKKIGNSFVLNLVEMGAFSLAALLLVVVIFGYYKWKYQYWRKKKLPFLQPQIPFGNLLNPPSTKECLGAAMARIYSAMVGNMAEVISSCHQCTSLWI
jgi:hypothetical protein